MFINYFYSNQCMQNAPLLFFPIKDGVIGVFSGRLGVQMLFVRVFAPVGFLTSVTRPRWPIIAVEKIYIYIDWNFTLQSAFSDVDTICILNYIIGSFGRLNDLHPHTQRNLNGVLLIQTKFGLKSSRKV